MLFIALLMSTTVIILSCLALVAKGPGEAAPAGHPVRRVLLEPLLRLPRLLYFAAVLLLAHWPRPVPTVMPLAADVVRSSRVSVRAIDSIGL